MSKPPSFPAETADILNQLLLQFKNLPTEEGPGAGGFTGRAVLPGAESEPEAGSRCQQGIGGAPENNVSPWVSARAGASQSWGHFDT